jgi:predicted ribosomally synthesized peptide with nif11-like leader
MSSKSYRAFRAKIEEDAKLREQMLAAGSADGMSVEKLTSIASAYGFHFTVSDVTRELGEDLRTSGREDTFDFKKVSQEFWKVAFDPVACSLQYFRVHPLGGRPT